MKFRTVNKHCRTLCYLVVVCCTVYIIRSGMIPLRLNDSCPPLVLANDIGRFGNKFFEYLASFLVAEVLHRDVYVTISFANLYDRYFSGGKSLKIASEGVCPGFKSEAFILGLAAYDNLQPGNYSDKPFIHTEGYPFHITISAWKQIFNRRDELIQQFRWHPELKSAVDRQMAELRTEHNASVVVGVHVRMTDYYIYLMAFYGSFRPADSAFFTRAMNHFRFKYAKPVFLVISNDINWCKDHLQGDDIVYPGEGDEDDPGWDLAILASCDHLILTYGTFGYMAAWFKGPAGEVLVADNYTSKPEKMFERLKAANPPNWTYLST